MAVRVADRNKSAVQFVDDARKIADIICDRMTHFINKIQRKYNNEIRWVVNRIYNYYYEMPIRLATSAYLCVTYGNRIYIRDEETLKRRTNQFKKAIECYNKLVSMLSIIFNNFGYLFNSNAIANIVDLIDNEVKQLKSIEESDKLRLNSTELSERS